MPKYLDNILSEPAELLRSLDYTLAAGRPALQQAAGIVREARDIIITGIGSSWHAGMAVQAIFASRGRLTHLADASELLHFGVLPENAVLIALSRSGKSVEIVKLLDKAAAARVPVIAVTNTPESPLAQRARVVLKMEAAFDHLVSVTMYSALTLVGGLLAAETLGISKPLHDGLRSTLLATEKMLPRWKESIAASAWFSGDLATYFLARDGSVASCHETRLLWEEAAKSPASAMPTGGFRHGPQEMLLSGARIGLWLHPTRMRQEDLSLLQDLRRHGAKTMIVGHQVESDAADLVLPLPELPQECFPWQFLVDIVPGQLAAFQMSRQSSVDPDHFAICPYIITSEGGLK